jgi:uncharacterized protein YgbK (DUF1537 family)
MSPVSTRSTPLPNGLLACWYGDDFTGAAAVMEALTLASLPAVVFCDIPTQALIERFPGMRGIGIAGIARSKSPLWMDEHLPEVFAALAKLDAPIAHYKVCSTFDSAPQVGSIGKAIDLAAPWFDSEWIPLLVAAPAIRRYQVFGNLFAAATSETYRLDRHPTMSRHPITPMSEADVRLHLGKQTQQPVGLIDILALGEGRGLEVLESELASACRLLAIDVLDDHSLVAAGELIWERRGRRLFAVGSQGIEYALIAYWRHKALIEAKGRPMHADPVERIAVVSGSCSQVTAGQISWAEANGFELIRLDARRALDEQKWSFATIEATEKALRAVERGRDPVIFTARGPDDSAVQAFTDALRASGREPEQIHQTIAEGLGSILCSIFSQTSIRRGILAGGDTSSHGLKMLDVDAVTLLAPTVPGAALFQAHRGDSHEAPFEIAMKGGQMGAVDYFGQIKQGGVAAVRRGERL